MNNSELLLPELDELASEVGEFICYWGFKKIHGRIWTHVYLSRTPLDAGQLTRRLRVSKALISLSINELLEFEVIQESSKSNRGTQTYVANPNILNVISGVLRKRERKMLTKAETSCKLLASIEPERIDQAELHQGRVDGIGRLISEAQDVLTGFLELTAIDFKGWLHLNETSDFGSKKPPQSL